MIAKKYRTLAIALVLAALLPVFVVRAQVLDPDGNALPEAQSSLVPFVFPDGSSVSVVWGADAAAQSWSILPASWLHVNSVSEFMNIISNAWASIGARARLSTNSAGNILQVACGNGSVFTATYVTATPSTVPGGTGAGPTTGSTNSGVSSTAVPAVCEPHDSCVGNTIRHTKADCTVSTYVSCKPEETCNPGSNVCSVRTIDFVSSLSTADGLGGIAGVLLTGHLQAKPTLVSPKMSTHLYWNVLNAATCKVTDDSGSLLSTAITSGSAGIMPGPISGTAVYTLHCAARAGATPNSIDEKQTINLIPAFQEK